MDIDRVIRAKNQGDLDYSDNKTFERALELLDLTIADSKNSGHRLRELGKFAKHSKIIFGAIMSITALMSSGTIISIISTMLPPLQKENSPFIFA